MAIRLYFPVTVRGKDSQDQSDLLLQVSEGDDQPGLYVENKKIPLEDFSEDPKTRSALELPVKNVALSIGACGHGEEAFMGRVVGASLGGCLSFINSYRCDCKHELKVAISYASTPGMKRKDGKVTDDEVPAKIQLAKDLAMNLLILPLANKSAIPEEDKELANNLDDVHDIDDLKGKSLHILLAKEGWEKTLAKLLSLSPRDSIHAQELKAPECEDHDESGQNNRRLYDLYMAALFSDEPNSDEAKKFVEIFKKQGKNRGIGDTPLQPNTFAHELLIKKKNDYIGKIFDEDTGKRLPHLIFSGATSTGKTTLAKALLLNALSMNIKAIYIAPTRALVYEVYDDFTNLIKDIRENAETDEYLKEIYKNLNLPSESSKRMICSTGEQSECDGQIIRGYYDIIFSVYEKANIFMNLMVDKPAQDVPRLVIIDELHMLTDNDRGGIVDMFIAKSQDITPPSRIVGITTEKTGSSTIMHFLESLPEKQLNASDTHQEKAFLVDVETRPVEVTHYLQLGRNVEKIDTLYGNEIPKIVKRRRMQIANTLREKYLRDPEFSYDMLLCPETYADWGIMMPKKIILVLNSIEGIYEVVGRIARSRLGERTDFKKLWKDGECGSEYCNKDVLDKLRTALAKSLINSDEQEILWGGAKAGIFAYFSPMDYNLRQEMGAAFRAPFDASTQMLLTTEALAYGVNLPADAIFLTYINDISNQNNLLSKNVFFNLLGRVGRLGKVDTASSAFILPYGDVKPGSSEAIHDGLLNTLKFYNGESEDFYSSAFGKEDIDRLNPENNGVKNLDDISYSTFRSALDALRFANEKTKRHKGKMYSGVYDVRLHLRNSLLGWQVDKSTKGSDSPSRAFGFMLAKIYDTIKNAESFKNNMLVTQDDKIDVQDMGEDLENNAYRCTELGAALIDTGTSWQAIEPMAAWLESIREFNNGIPVELLLVGILPVKEMWEDIRAFDQYHKKNITSITPESKEWATRALSEEIDRLQDPEHFELSTEEILKLIDNFIEKHCTHLQLSSSSINREPLKFEVRQNSFYRLLAACLAWARGEIPDKVQKFASPYEDESRKDFSRSFSPRYGDRASWLCVLMLRFFSRTQPGLCPAHEASLQTLAMRMRYGVPKEYIPMMGSGKARKTRTDIMSYIIESKLSLATVMRKSYEEYSNDMEFASNIELRRCGGNDFKDIHDNAVTYFFRAAADFCSELSRGARVATQESWRSLQECLTNNLMNGAEKIGLTDVIEHVCRIVRSGVFECDPYNGGITISEKSGKRAELYIEILDAWSPGGRDKLAKQLGELNKKGVEKLCVWYPWKTVDLPSPNLPAINFMSALFLLRMLEEDGKLDNTIRWLKKQRAAPGDKFFPIQSLISETKQAVQDLRAILPGAIQEGVLQMVEPIFND